MHDRNGKALKVGDEVVIRGRITQVSATEENFCNCTVETIYGRRPDDQKEKIYAINTGVLLRDNPEDRETS